MDRKHFYIVQESLQEGNTNLTQMIILKRPYSFNNQPN